MYQNTLKIKKKFKDLITIIAPRHIERSKEIKLLSRKFGLNAQILNINENILASKELVIINHFGALNSYFKYAKSVFIGKSTILSLKDQGGQSPVEAAKLDCKIYHGPYVYNFEEIYKTLEKNNISKKINNFEELTKNLAIDLQNPKKKDTNKNKNLINKLGQKTLDDTIILINNFLNDKNK